MESKKVKSTKKTAARIKELPSVQQLIKDSWELFSETALSYLKLLGLLIAYIFLGVIIGVLIAVPLSFTSIFAHHNIDQLSTFPVVMLFLFVFWIVLFILSLIIISFVFPVASILILQGKKTTSIFDFIGQSKRFILPYFLTALLAGIVAVGGLVLFMLPGLLIAFFFAFVAYEVVLDNQTGKEALARSYILVKNHFWEVLGRFLLLEVGIFLISSILGHLEKGSWVLMLVQILFSLFSGWYARAYTFLLYKQLKERTAMPQKISVQWIWIVSSIGWVLLVLLIIGLAYGASTNTWMMMHTPTHHKMFVPQSAV